jgi:hypothetical protein
MDSSRFANVKEIAGDATTSIRSIDEAIVR